MTELEKAAERIRQRLEHKEESAAPTYSGKYPISEESFKENSYLIQSVEKAQTLCNECDGIHCKQRVHGMKPTLSFSGDLVTEVLSVCPKAIKGNLKLRDLSNIPKRYANKSFNSIIENEGNTEALSALRWCLEHREEEKNGVFIQGSNGTGKTLMSIAFANESIKNGVETLFIPVVELLGKIKKSYSSNENQDFLDTVLNVPCLVLDDLGSQRMNAWVASELYLILNYRYMYMLQTVITSNYSMNELFRNLHILSDNGVLKDDENIGKQIMSRIAGMCLYVSVSGKDQRFSQDVG